MGCINTSPVIKIKSIKSFKETIEKKIKQNKSQDPSNKVLSFSDFSLEDSVDSNSVNEQSQILIQAQIEDKELIFL